MVMDWGVAKSLAADEADTEAGTIIGTHGFMAPEQARGDTRDLDERTDVYALGAILLELLPAPRFRGRSGRYAAGP